VRLTPRQYRADEGDAPRVYRLDRATGLGRARRTDEGYLVVEGYIAKPGVLRYRNADGSWRRELVLPEELHRADSLATIDRKPVTLNHPPVNQRPVGPHNVRRLGVGDASEPSVAEDGHVKMSLIVRDAAAIRAVESGQHELSPGYSVRLDMTPGVHPEFGEYDAIQRDRRYDHLAIVGRARGGSTVRLRADEAAGDTFTPPSKESKMNPTLLMLAAGLGLALRHDMSDEAAGEAIRSKQDDLKSRADAVDAAEAALAVEKTRADTAEEALAAKEQERADAAAQVMDLPAMVAWSSERSALEKAAREHKIDGLDKLDEMTGEEIRKAVVTKAQPEARADGSEDYYRAAFDMLPADEMTGEEIRKAPRGGRTDSFGGMTGPRKVTKPKSEERADSPRVDGTKPYNDTFDEQRAKLDAAARL